MAHVALGAAYDHTPWGEVARKRKLLEGVLHHHINAVGDHFRRYGRARHCIGLQLQEWLFDLPDADHARRARSNSGCRISGQDDIDRIVVGAIILPGVGINVGVVAPIAITGELGDCTRLADQVLVAHVKTQIAEFGGAGTRDGAGARTFGSYQVIGRIAICGV